MNSWNIKPALFKISFMDGIIGLLILSFSIGMIFYLYSGGNEKDSVIITYKDSRIDQRDLHKNDLIKLDMDHVHMEIEIKDGKIRVKYSNCPHQICVRKGWTGLANDPVICLPNHVMVNIKSKDSEIDAVSD
jgi:hypothetical protein